LYYNSSCTSPSPLPDLHAFPTRRSSDLSNHCGDSKNRRDQHCVACHHETGIVSGRRNKNILCGRQGSKHCRSQDTVLVQLKYERDRKSTRLNSSHVSISYAVFCLKKKTT